MAITIPLNGYCAVTDVEAMLHNPSAITATSVPTTTQVEAWIEEEYHDINGMLRKAGYLTPMTAVAASFASTGTLRLYQAHLMGDDELVLTATTLAGQINPGDLFLLGGQYYAAQEQVVLGSGDSTLSVSVSPRLRADAVVDTAVTYGAELQAAKLLLRLNAGKVAARAEGVLATAGADEPNAIADSMIARTQGWWDDIATGRVRLLGAARSLTRSGPGMVRLQRRG